MDVFHCTIDTSHGAVRISDTIDGAAPLVMIHGSGSSRTVFSRQLHSHLSRNWRLIALDLPGHGESSDARDPQSTYTVTGLADCIGEVAARLGLHRFPVLGWSLGGHVAIEMAGSGNGISGLMLCGTPPVPSGLLGMLRGFHPSFDILLASKENFTSRDVARFQSLCFGDTSNPSFRDAIARADGRLRSVFSRAMLRGEGVDQRRTVEQADIPIAFVNGFHDVSHIFAQSLPSAVILAAEAIGIRQIAYRQENMIVLGSPLSGKWPEIGNSLRQMTRRITSPVRRVPCRRQAGVFHCRAVLEGPVREQCQRRDQ